MYHGWFIVADFPTFRFLFQVLQTVKFKFPILLTLIHYVVSWFLMAVLKAFSLLPPSPSTKSTRMSTLFTLGFVMSLSTGFANVSLKYNR
jgi:solute carrier family 35 protein E3